MLGGEQLADPAVGGLPDEVFAEVDSRGCSAGESAGGTTVVHAVGASAAHTWRCGEHPFLGQVRPQWGAKEVGVGHAPGHHDLVVADLPGSLSQLPVGVMDDDRGVVLYGGQLSGDTAQVAPAFAFGVLGVVSGRHRHKRPQRALGHTQ